MRFILGPHKCESWWRLDLWSRTTVACQGTHPGAPVGHKLSLVEFSFAELLLLTCSRQWDSNRCRLIRLDKPDDPLADPERTCSPGHLARKRHKNGLLTAVVSGLLVKDSSRVTLQLNQQGGGEPTPPW